MFQFSNNSRVLGKIWHWSSDKLTIFHGYPHPLTIYIKAIIPKSLSNTISRKHFDSSYTLFQICIISKILHKIVIIGISND